MQVDPSFEGLDGGAGSLIKWNPVANVDGKDIWTFLRTMDVPVNSLHAQVSPALQLQLSFHALFACYDQLFLEVQVTDNLDRLCSSGVRVHWLRAVHQAGPAGAARA